MEARQPQQALAWHAVTDQGICCAAGPVVGRGHATDGMRVLTLADEIDDNTGDTLRQALDASGTPQPRVVVDMRQATFMDSTGIDILIAARALSPQTEQGRAALATAVLCSCQSSSRAA